MSKNIKLNIYTDSASFNNGRKNKSEREHTCSAGVIVHPKTNTIVYGTYNYNPDTSISYGEMFAVYMMIKSLSDFVINGNCTKRIKVKLYSDSNYTVSSIRDWQHNWKKNDVNGIWYTSSGKPVVYQEIIEAINEILDKDLFDFKIYHIRGHINMGKSVDVNKALKSWKQINKGEISREKLDIHAYYNNVCDKYAVESLRQCMRGDLENHVERKRFKKYK